MSFVTFPRWPGDRRSASPTGARLQMESLEDRSTPASLLSTDFTLSQSLPSDASILSTSNDGRYVLFQSTAINVIQGQIDTPGTNDLFWLDTATGERRLVSAERKSGGLKAAGAEVTVAGGTAMAVLSGNGLSVAFVSKTNAKVFDSPFGFGVLDINDNANATADVYYWNADFTRAAVQVTTGGLPTPLDGSVLISRVSGDTAFGNTVDATNPAISFDGSVVSFVSNLDAGLADPTVTDSSPNATADIFYTKINRLQIVGGAVDRDIDAGLVATYFTRDVAGVPTRFTFGKFGGDVQVDPLGRYLGGDGFTYAVISGISPNQVDMTWSPSAPGTMDLYYIRQDQNDPATNDIALVSAVPGSTSKSANGKVTNAIVASSASDVVVFSATVPGGVNVLVSGYQNNNGGAADLYLRSVSAVGASQPTVLVSSQFQSLVEGGDGVLDSRNGSFSVTPDGKKVVFASTSTNFVNNVTDTNGTFDVFLWDIATEVATPLSVVPSGVSTANGESYNPRVTQDGGFVAYESVATNLVGIRDDNSTTDIFVRDVSGGFNALASISADFASTGNGPSFGPVIGGSGSTAFIRFNSVATNLDPVYTVPTGVIQIYTVTTPILGLGADRTLAVSGGRNGFAGTATFDAFGNLVFGPPIIPFPGFTGEIRTAVADVTGDGIVDLIVGAGPGGGPRVKVIDGSTQATILDFFAFEASFTGGVFVAAADFTGDGKADLVIGAGVGGGPRVLVLDSTNLSVLADLFVFEPTFRGGARVATGDFNGDGIPDIVTSAAEGGGPRVLVVNGATLPNLVPLADFFAFEGSLRNGAYVATGDFNGDGRDDIVAGAGPGGASRVQVFDAATVNNPPVDSSPVLYNFFAFGSDRRDGVRVAVKQIDSDGTPDIVTGAGAGTPLIRTYAGGRFQAPQVPQLIDEAFAFGDTFGMFGAWVG